MDARFPLIPKDEYVSRLGRAREEMLRRDIDLLVLTSKENLRYFAGYNPGAWIIPNYYYILLLPRESVIGPALLVAEPYQTGAQMSWVSDVRTWKLGAASFMEETSPAHDLVTDVMEEMKVSAGTIGFELGSHSSPHVGHSHLARLIESLGEARVIDATDAARATRMIKSPFEIDLMSRACDITGRAIAAGFAQIRPGATERDLASVMGSTALALGATGFDFLSLFTYPARSGWANCPPSNYVLAQGDLVHFDGGFIVEGYQCDIIREASVGQPSKEQERCYRVNRESVEAGIDAVRPGVLAKEVYEAVVAVKRAAGFGAFVDWLESNGLGAVGHGIGLDLHEPPA